ncbi:uncharacterized protein LOC119957796 [Scyliorhinus canicula]|uniref:uncharacterized protein LOC119957796 n=1 Tax=Scyliorhinus canicula TaxID=7830 RepID=UPI0018F6CB79|nr:uncharacterized protein LOC119957796 [Scyliorhinus canicula]XP_038641826.1 uncharacterized protein LOC119957796 [Scyliorhinus canicula]
MMLSGRPLYGAGCLAPGTGDLASRLSPQAKTDRSLWAPHCPAGRGQWQGNGCCWRRAPLKLAEDSARAVQLPGRHPWESLEGLGNIDAKRPTCLGGAVARPAEEGEDRPCPGAGHTMKVEGGLYLRAGPKAEAEAGPCYPAGHRAEACVGPYHGVSSTAEAEGRLFHGGGPTAESVGRLHHGAGPTAGAEGRPYHGAGPTAETEGKPYHGAGPTAETEGRPFHGAGPTAETEGRPYHGAGPTAETEGRPYRGAGPTAETEGRPYHGAGPTAETEGRPYRGAGPTAETEGRPYHGAGPTAETEGRPYHGAGPTAEAEGRPFHGAGPMVESEGRLYHGAGPTAEAEGRPYHGAGPTAEAKGGRCHESGHTLETADGRCDGVGTVEAECKAPNGTGPDGNSQDCAKCTYKDGAFKEQTEPHRHQWNVQATKGTVTKVTDLSETQEDIRLSGLVTMETGTVESQAQLRNGTRTGEKVGTSGCEEHKKAEEPDDEFGSFEKAGNLVHWAEYPGPLRLEDEHEGSGTAAGRSQESDSSNGTEEEGWQRTCPPTTIAPSRTLTSEDGWRAFSAEDGQTQEKSFDAFPLDRWGATQCGAGETWWLRHTFRPTSPSESSLDNFGLESVFHSCFPAVSSARSSDTIPPLGQLLAAEKGGEGSMSAQARDLWDSLQNVDQAVGLKYKWSECQSRKHLLASLCVDPANVETPTGHSRTLGSSLLLSRETTMESQPSPVSPSQDYKELMLIKNSVPQLQNGLSPTHRIQAFFHHWTQADRNGKSKTSYDFNKNFMA